MYFSYPFLIILEVRKYLCGYSKMPDHRTHDDSRQGECAVSVVTVYLSLLRAALGHAVRSFCPLGRPISQFSLLMYCQFYSLRSKIIFQCRGGLSLTSSQTVIQGKIKFSHYSTYYLGFPVTSRIRGIISADLPFTAGFRFVPSNSCILCPVVWNSKGPGTCWFPQDGNNPRSL